MAQHEGLLRRIWRAIWPQPADDDTGEIPAIPGEPPRPAGSYEPPPLSTPLVVPGAGDVFDLHVILHLSWQNPTENDNLSYQQLESLARVYHDTAINSILKTIWRLARTLDPMQPADAEAAMNADPEMRKGQCFGDDSGTVRCVPSVRVFLDPKLREHKSPLEVLRLKMQEEHALNKIRDGYVKERTEDWLHAFQNLEAFARLGKDERQFLLPFAATLVDDRLSKVTQALARDRHRRYNELVDVLTRASKDHERLGLFEFANAYDKALRSFCRQMGIDIGQWMLADFGGPEAGNGEQLEVTP